MSKKSDLKALIQNYKAAGDQMSKKISEIKKSNNFTLEGKNQFIQEEKQKLAALGQQTKEKALQIVREGMASISKAARPNAQDPNYQLSLSNALKLLELGANNMSKDDIKTLLEPFAGDHIATAAFKGALTNTGMKPMETIGILPIDERGNSIKWLQGIENTINNYINPSTEWDGLTGAGIAIYGVDSSIDDLDDNLNYIHRDSKVTAENFQE
ncbi:MAG: hypothetical protein Q8900_06845 [Bacillota bacterium]|nr:hypothetical protein [Bacillota bacterium]